MLLPEEFLKIAYTFFLCDRLGAPPLVELEGLIDPLEIAEKELSLYKVPLIVRRYLPDGSFEDWKISDFMPKAESLEEDTQRDNGEQFY